MKHLKKTTSKKQRQKKILNVLLILLVIAIFVLAATLYRDYQARPGFLKKIWISERGADYLTVKWEKPRNVYKYVISYNGKTISVSGMRSEMRLTGLDEDTEYKISVRADSRQREGFDTLTDTARTKKRQSIEGESVQMKFANTLVDLKLDAETDITYLSKNSNMKIMGDKVMFTRPGKYVVTVKTAESSDYVAATKKITVDVLDTINVDAEGASPHIFYKLNAKNCELVMPVRGVKEAKIPQSFEKIKDKYYILYVAKSNKTQRILTFNESKNVFKPKLNLGHGNGLAVANETCYAVQGGDERVITFNTSNKNYNSFKLPYKASGIAFDEKNGLFYTSQHQGMTAYDNNFNEISRFKRITRKGKHYAQDGGAYGGIMMHCISDAGYYGTNYIDFYDMIHKKYIGSIECDLDEVESLLVDDEGFVELLCNNKSDEDYIWKTPINMKMLLD